MRVVHFVGTSIWAGGVILFLLCSSIRHILPSVQYFSGRISARSLLVWKTNWGRGVDSLLFFDPIKLINFMRVVHFVGTSIWVGGVILFLLSSSIRHIWPCVQYFSGRISARSLLFWKINWSRSVDSLLIFEKKKEKKSWLILWELCIL